MITELAFLSVKPDAGPAFEAAFGDVAHLLAGAEGHIGHRLVPALDEANLYLLEVEWRDLAAHVALFEPSMAHAQFMEALEPLLAGEPSVIHVPTRSAERPASAATGAL